MEENKKKSRKGKKVALFIGGTLLMAVVGYVAYKKCPVVGGFIRGLRKKEEPKVDVPKFTSRPYKRYESYKG